MTAYYNEIDPYAAQWLRNLIAAGHIASGDVDERSIEDIAPDDLRPYKQCHFFAGIGVWSYALRRAGWNDDRPIWTGSCPCQPFSAAGKGGGFADERHLWPAWHHLIAQCAPPIVVGEQVASKDGLGWLDLVSADMEGTGYAFGAADLCAAGFDGAHIRQRLYWVADANGYGHGEHGFRVGGAARAGEGRLGQRQRVRPNSPNGLAVGGLADDDDDAGLQGRGGAKRDRVEPNGQDAACGPVSGLGNTFCAGRQPKPDGCGSDGPRMEQAGSVAVEPSETGGNERCGLADNGRGGREMALVDDRCGRTADSLGAASVAGMRGVAAGSGAPMLGRNPVDWLYCRDGKWRPVEPGTFPLAHAPAARMGRLRAYGNGLDAETATQFIAAVMDCQP